MKRLTVLSLFLIAPLLIGAGSTSTSRRPAAEEQHLQAYNQGVREQERGNYQSAIDHYRRALRRKPDFPDALNNLAFSIRSLASQELDEAMGYYERALSLQPDHEQALEYQGELFLWRGELRRARENHDHLKRLGSPEADKLGRALDAVLSQARALR